MPALEKSFVAANTAIATEAEWSAERRRFASDGVHHGLANTLEVIAGTGRQVKVRTGRATINGFLAINEAEKSISLTANTSGSPRTDLIVLRWTPITGASVEVKTGTTSLDQVDGGTWETELARVTVANGYTSVSGSDITDGRSYSLPGAGGKQLLSMRAYLVNPISCTDDTLTDVTLGVNEWHDAANERLHSTTSNTMRLLAPWAGVYSGVVQASFAANSTGWRLITALKNGSTEIVPPERRSAISGQVTPVTLVIPEVRLSAGDYVRIRARQNSGGALNLLGSANSEVTHAIWRYHGAA